MEDHPYIGVMSTATARFHYKTRHNSDFSEELSKIYDIYCDLRNKYSEEETNRIFYLAYNTMPVDYILIVNIRDYNIKYRTNLVKYYKSDLTKYPHETCT
jgi:hypothetical protein